MDKLVATESYEARPKGHTRSYDFSFVVESFGSVAALRIARAWEFMEAKPGRLTARYMSFRRWLRWIADYPAAGPLRSLVVETRRRVREGTVPTMDVAAFRRLCDAYGEHLVDSKGRTIASGRTDFSNVSVVLQTIGDVAGFQKLGRPLAYPQRLPASMETTTPTLAEITRRGKVDWFNPDEAADQLLADIGVNSNALSFDAKLDAIRGLNAKRLSALRRCLEKEFEEALQRFRNGRRILALENKDSAADLAAALPLPPKEFSAWMDRRFAGDPSRMLSAILHYLLMANPSGVFLGTKHERHLLPFIRQANLLDAVGGVREKVARRAGAVATPRMQESLQGLVALTADGWNAAVGILLIDTGWNVQPLTDLPVRCFVGGVRRGAQIVVTTRLLQEFKVRAGHDVQAVLATLPRDEQHAASVSPTDGQKFSSVDVIEAVEDMTELIRPVRKEGPLLLCARPGFHAVGVVPDLTGQHRLWSDFLARVVDDPDIGGLPITRPMIRKTVLDLEAARSDGDYSPVQMLADHSSGGTTMRRYLRTPWFRRELMNHMRRFHGLLEATLSKDIADVAHHLGIDEAELLQRKELANETGLGSVCLRPLDGIQPGTVPGRPCHRVDLCHLGCPARRMVPTERALTALVLTNRSLKASETEWIIRNPERWAKVWMPLLAETEAYLERLADSSHRVRLKDAVAHVEVMLASGEVELTQIW